MRRFGFFIGLLFFAIIINNCGKDNSTSPTIPNPSALFTESGGTVTPATISFTNMSTNADSYLWRFGDGDSTTITNPTHVYDTHGYYSVTLIARNNATGASDIEMRQIEITPGKVYIGGIIIEDIPFTDSYGAGWDLFTGPDVYPQVADSNNVLFTTQTYYLDVAPSDLPLNWNLSPDFEMTHWGTHYFVRVWDYDDTGDDYMGSSYGFSIDDVISSEGYVSEITRGNSAGNIQVVVGLRWE